MRMPRAGVGGRDPVSISEEQVMAHLDWLMTRSEPGSEMHHLVVASVPPGAVGPLGLPDGGKVEVSVAAIAPVGAEETERFILRSIVATGVELRGKGHEILFVAFGQEFWMVAPQDRDELARRLEARGRLHEHPAVVEATVVYAACRDGRRWQGRRWLTGPRAGETDSVDLLVGGVVAGEGLGMPVAPVLRRFVGLSV